MNILTLPLLGALSSTDITEDNELQKELNKVRKSIHEEVDPKLRSCRFVAKSRLARALERCINDADTLCVLPQLLGRSCIGIVEGSLPLQGIISALGEGLAAHAEGPLLLPHLLLPQDEHRGRVRALSHAGKIINFSDLVGHPADAGNDLTDEEYRTLMGLTGDGINPRDVIAALVHFTPLRRKNSTYLLLPREEFCRAGASKLAAHCNAIIIMGNVTPYEILEPLRNNFTMPIYIISGNASDVQGMAAYLKGRYAGRQVEILPPHELENLLSSLDTPVQRVTLHDRLLAELLQVEEDLSAQIERVQDLEKALKRDSVLAGQAQEALGERLEASQKAIRGAIKSLKREKDTFSQARSAVLQTAEEMEKCLDSKTHKDLSPTRLHAGAMRPEALWRRIILRALVAGDMPLAEKYQAKIEGIYPDQAFLTSLYIRKKKGLPISGDEIARLRFMPDSPETLRAKIYFRQELDLTEKDCSNIAALLPRRKDAAEKYYWARHLYDVYQENKDNGRPDNLPFMEVIAAFREAVLAGSDDAAELFARFCGGENRVDEAQEIADMGNPTGAYIFRLLSITKGQEALANRYLKLAAALGHPKALAISVEKFWDKRLYGQNVSFDHDSGAITGLDANTVQSAIALYESLLKQPELAKNISDFGEKLGYFLFCDKQWQQSRYHIGDAPNTAEGCFCLGIMLKYGLGGNRNKDDAIRMIRKAEGQAGPFSTLAYKVKAKWYAEDLLKP